MRYFRTNDHDASQFVETREIVDEYVGQDFKSIFLRPSILMALPQEPVLLLITLQLNGSSSTKQPLTT